MPFDLSHWDRPRDTIACNLRSDDYSYAIHGAQLAAQFLQKLNLPLSELGEMKCLDYGCGTARVARVLASYFHRVYAYDPNEYCRSRARNEGKLLSTPNLHIVDSLAEVPHCDVACCIHVIEHLDDDRAQTLLDNLRERADRSVIWYSPAKNKNVMPGYPTKNIIEIVELRRA